MLMGAHVSISKSVDLCFDRAQAIGANTIQIFTRNRMQWKIPLLAGEKVRKFQEKHKISGVDPVVIHMPYLPNPSSPEPERQRQAVEQLVAEIKRAHALGVSYVVTHLGSHKGSGVKTGLRNACRVLKSALVKTKLYTNVMVLLENTAGSPRSVGGRFEEIQHILHHLNLFESRLGVCFDTCHAFAAGYDLRSKKTTQATLDVFDELVGLNRMQVIHVNDSKGGLGSHLDRHEHIGLGEIGLEGFRVLLTDQRINKKPFILETPHDSQRGDQENLEVLRQLTR